MSKPPPLPSEVFSRVLRLATFDGRCLLFIAGIFAIGSGVMGDYTGALTGTVAAGAGVIELHGAHLLRASQPRGMRWLIGSQLLLLVTILLYAWTCILTFDTAMIAAKLSQIPAPMLEPLRTAMENLGGSLSDLVPQIRRVVVLSYSLLGLLTVLYQGGMAFYYHRRRRNVISHISLSTSN